MNRLATRQVVEGSELREVEEETLRRLTELRHTIAGRVKSAHGIHGVRSALLQLFDGFTLHRATSKAAPPRVHRISPGSAIAAST